ncbi:MAG: glycosyltransferase family 2 protein [Pseudomonadota bacterium]
MPEFASALPSHLRRSPLAAKPVLSIIVPVLNEEAAIPPFFEAIRPVFRTLKKTYALEGCFEIVFVDDGSTDRTVDIIRSVRLNDVAIKVVKLARNFGKDPALAAGLAHASGEAVIPMDVDLQDPPDVIIDMVAAWKKGAMVVNAVRADRTTDSWFKRHSANVFYALFNRISSYPIKENVGDFRLLDRKVVDVLINMPERVRFMKGLFSWLGYPSEDVYYKREARTAGQTKWKPLKLFNFAIDGITGSSTLPLRIWTIVGCTMAIVALLYATFIIARTVLFGIDVPGYASLMVVTLVANATTLIAIGILGEYVGRISIEVRQRPLYVVETVFDDTVE